MTDALLDRLRRLREWAPTFSSAGLALAARAGTDVRRLAAALALVESLYPLELRGHTLAEGVDAGLVDRLLAHAPEVDRLEDDYAAHHDASWPLWISGRPYPPAADRLHVPGSSWAGKPVGALYTSDATPAFPGMWFAHLLGDGEHPLPWYAWRLHVGQPVRELVISSAREWCALVARHGTGRGLVDWSAVARSWDAVRVTPRAVLAVDAFAFTHEGRSLVPVHWGVETTVWLRWVFDRVEPVALPSFVDAW